MSESSIGIDVSKDRLDVHRLPDDAQAAFANSRAGLTKLISWIGAGPITRIVFEPTGRYHRDLERRLAEAGFPLVKVNPRQARRFAEALGVRAKTDRADAAILARMGAALALEPQAIRSETLRELQELIIARRALFKDRTAAKNRQKGLHLTLLRRQTVARITQIKADLAAIDRLIADRIAADTALAARRDILTSIAGVSDVTAAMLIALAPELGSLDQRQIASLAPITRQSGTWRGKAFIRGGRALLREALYMPALVAIRFNPDLKRAYDRLTNNGKPKKLALTAVMRKLIILANALVRDKRKWTPQTP